MNVNLNLPKNALFLLKNRKNHQSLGSLKRHNVVVK